MLLGAEEDGFCSLQDPSSDLSEAVPCSDCPKGSMYNELLQKPIHLRSTTAAEM